jgi:hypothetical protein
MTGTILPFPGPRSARRPAGTPVRTREDVEALAAEHPVAVVDTAIGLLAVRRDTPGGLPVYQVGVVGGLTSAQAAKLCLMIGACLPDLPGD